MNFMHGPPSPSPGGRWCFREDPAKQKGENAIPGTHSSWVGQHVLAFARPWQQHVQKYNLPAAFAQAGIGMIMNLQEVGEHDGCGPGNLRHTGFSYDPEWFTAAGVGVYNINWRDMGVPDLNTIMEVVQVSRRRRWCMQRGVCVWWGGGAQRSSASEQQGTHASTFSKETPTCHTGPSHTPPHTRPLAAHTLDPYTIHRIHIHMHTDPPTHPDAPPPIHTNKPPFPPHTHRHTDTQTPPWRVTDSTDMCMLTASSRACMPRVLTCMHAWGPHVLACMGSSRTCMPRVLACMHA